MKPPKKGKGYTLASGWLLLANRPFATCTVWIALDEANIGNGV
ncbi:MAG: hypothetical protein CM1200mP13_17740 [Candidatus Pelagibacterales bacterium]|nr:MAG: hypothetical protein CM1200mP13_17740 [Pelagibacterales bacterium]